MRTPQEIVQFVNKSSAVKLDMPLRKLLILGFIGGVYIAFGALLSVTVGSGFPGVAAENPAIVKLLMGVVFPIGLIAIVLAGGELFTGCCATLAPNLLSGRSRWISVVKFCAIVWIANFIGSLFVGYFMVYLPELSHSYPTVDGFFAVAKAKTSNPFYITLLKGVAANWLVCLAIWLGISSKNTPGKIMGIWFPIMTFVTLGFEHSIANMFLLPVAMMEGFDISICDMMMSNIIPATLGNIIGGGLFIGGFYWYLYDR